MREVSSIFGGIGLLIFAYLCVANYSGVTQIAGQIGTTGVSLITALQGRTSS
jgi:hypothetical protein